MMLKNSSERRYSFLVPNLSGKASSFSLSSRMLPIVSFYFVFLTISLYQVEKVSLFPSLLTSFVRNGYWILSNVSAASTDMIIWYFFFRLLMWSIIVVDFFFYLKNLAYLVYTTWLWSMVFYMLFDSIA